jgi:tRNA-splicing ligase RtcB
MVSHNLRGMDNTLAWVPEYEIESSALEQLRNISRLPWVHGVRVMPDVHMGKGATVGSVIAMKDAVSPNAVGVDIGCGVSGVRTNLTLDDLPESLHAMRLRVEAAIPVGFNGHESGVNVRSLGFNFQQFVNFWKRFDTLHEGVQDRLAKAHQQLGSLGGGNHFLEVCEGTDGFIWLTLHSGSRNIGKEIAERHVAIAKTLAHNAGIPDKDLAVFITGTSEMDAYRNDLDWAQEYAMRSRAIMMGLFKKAFAESVSMPVTFDQELNVHHNYVQIEHIDGMDLLVTRKGAIRAGSGDLGLIPGSMGVGSYVIKGLGNPQSYFSASHGAGRKMSRNKAKANFTVDDLIAQTSGIECRKDQGVVDEIPGAYKDIHAVMEAQSDLVEIVSHLQTLMCVKG